MRGRAACWYTRSGVIARLALALILVLVWAAPPAHAQQNVRGIDIAVTAGEPFTRGVAAFEHPMNHPPEFFPATIDWGDGSPRRRAT